MSSTIETVQPVIQLKGAAEVLIYSPQSVIFRALVNSCKSLKISAMELSGRKSQLIASSVRL